MPIVCQFDSKREIMLEKWETKDEAKEFDIKIWILQTIRQDTIFHKLERFDAWVKDFWLNSRPSLRVIQYRIFFSFTHTTERKFNLVGIVPLSSRKF